MTEINEIDNKFLVMKWEYIFNPNILTTEEHDTFKHCLHKVNEYRKQENKTEAQYVVLNVDEKIDHRKLIVNLETIDAQTSPQTILTVDDIATTLINAII